MAVAINVVNTEPVHVEAGKNAAWEFTISADDSTAKVSFDYSFGPDDDAPEWDVILRNSSDELWSNARSSNSVRVDIATAGPKGFKVLAGCPKGARYDDTIRITVTVSTDTGEDSVTLEAYATKSILVLKTQIDQEINATTDLYNKIKDDGTEKKPGTVEDVYAILCPDNLRGYVFVEGMNVDRLREKARNIKKARSFLEQPIPVSDIEVYLTPLSTVEGFEEGSLIEITKGPFKGEKARVKHIDESKEEITVELTDAMMPIPVTLNGDSVRVIEKEM